MTFIELTAGLAPCSLALQAGAVRPPITRPGIKTGYATEILGRFGLVPGQGADAYLWCDPDPLCASVLAAYAEPATLLAQALKLDAFAEMPAQDLWQRLRPAPADLAERLFVAGNSWKAESAHWKAPKDPAWSACLTARRLAQRLRALARIRWPEVFVLPVAHLPPEGVDCSACVVYIDATYEETTEYAFNLRRPDVVELARAWSGAGATVGVSEGEPVEGLPWHVVDITHGRVGHVRRWSKQQREYLTLNRLAA